VKSEGIPMENVKFGMLLKQDKEGKGIRRGRYLGIPS